MIDDTLPSKAKVYQAKAALWDALAEAVMALTPRLVELLDGALAQQRAVNKNRQDERARR